MKSLYAPWRGDYVSNYAKQKAKNACVFCDYVKDNKSNNETKQYILKRFKNFFVVMNTYPYAPAHFMIIPNAHIGDISSLSNELWSEMNLVAKKGVGLLKDVVNANGVNIGINLGECAGAGIAEHLHIHLVPRWHNDTNFTSTIANVRVFSNDFDDIYNKLLSKVDDYF
jgi:diadenosine tetraphosphate (Ap4A) HIT family hydrolase